MTLIDICLLIGILKCRYAKFRSVQPRFVATFKVAIGVLSTRLRMILAFQVTAGGSRASVPMVLSGNRWRRPRRMFWDITKKGERLGDGCVSQDKSRHHF